MATVKTYRWKTDAAIISGGYAGEDTGVLNGSTDWVVSTESAAASHASYYFRDSDSGQNANSSRVVVDIEDDWAVSFDDLNNMTVTVVSKINSIIRDDITGNPGTVGRDMYIRREAGGNVIWSVTNDPVSTAHTILGSPITLDSYSFTLAPGQSLSRGSIYFRNNTAGHGSDTVPSVYVDEMWLGATIQNIQPAPTGYRLSYDANGGSGAPSPQTRTTAQDSVIFTISDTTLTWGYYEFLGWSTTQYSDSRTESDVEYRPGEQITLTSSNPEIILYAVWKMDYRPGTSLDTNTGIWRSHNRPNGACHVLNGTTWQECRTIGGDAGAMGNPPSIYHDGKLYNQKLLGNET